VRRLQTNVIVAGVSLLLGGLGFGLAGLVSKRRLTWRTRRSSWMRLSTSAPAWDSCRARRGGSGPVRVSPGHLEPDRRQPVTTSQTQEKAGHVRIEKGYAGRRPRTWVRISRSGDGPWPTKCPCSRSWWDGWIHTSAKNPLSERRIP